MTDFRNVRAFEHAQQYGESLLEGDHSGRRLFVAIDRVASQLVGLINAAGSSLITPRDYEKLAPISLAMEKYFTARRREELEEEHHARLIAEHNAPLIARSLEDR